MGTTGPRPQTRTSPIMNVWLLETAVGFRRTDHMRNMSRTVSDNECVFGYITSV